MNGSVAHKLIESHLLDGNMNAGEEIGLRIDQTLTQDATGTMVMLELEALGVARGAHGSVGAVRRPQPAADRRAERGRSLFLRSAARKFGMWYSKPGNGVSHPVHMQRFGMPGETMARLGLAHLRGGLAGHARDRRGRPGGGDGDGRRAAVHHDARDLGRPPEGELPAVGERQGRDPGDAAPARRQGRGRADHRVPRARAGLADGDGPARDREHGRRAGGHYHRVPRRRQGPRVPGRRGPRATIGPKLSRRRGRRL